MGLFRPMASSFMISDPIYYFGLFATGCHRQKIRLLRAPDECMFRLAIGCHRQKIRLTGANHCNETGAGTLKSII